MEIGYGSCWGLDGVETRLQKMVLKFHLWSYVIQIGTPENQATKYESQS